MNHKPSLILILYPIGIYSGTYLLICLLKFDHNLNTRRPHGGTLALDFILHDPDFAAIHKPSMSIMKDIPTICSMYDMNTFISQR